MSTEPFDTVEELGALLPDQPAPTEGYGDVWAELLAGFIPDQIRPMCEERRSIGIARYGTPLQRRNGRDNDVDLIQELLDAAVYAQAANRRRMAVRLLRDAARIVMLRRLTEPGWPGKVP